MALERELEDGREGPREHHRQWRRHGEREEEGRNALPEPAGSEDGVQSRLQIIGWYALLRFTTSYRFAGCGP
jgi:hypothetical protein